MLSDEMTTGSVTTSDTDKRVYASRSHGWNLQQRRFREAFPEVSTMCPFHASGAVLRPASVRIVSKPSNSFISMDTGNLRSNIGNLRY
jgi:hypothetical protein